MRRTTARPLSFLDCREKNQRLEVMKYSLKLRLKKRFVRIGAMKRVAQLAIYFFERSESTLEIVIQCFVVLIAQFIASKLDASRYGAHVLLYQGSKKEERGKNVAAIECDERLRVENSLSLWNRRRGLHFLEFTSASPGRQIVDQSVTGVKARVRGREAAPEGQQMPGLCSPAL